MLRRLGACAILLWGFCGTLNAAESVQDNRPVVRIGVTSPLTGEMAAIGQDVVAWTKLAQDELAKKKTHYRYEVFLEDDQLQARQTIFAVKRLVELDKVNALLTHGSPPGAAAAPYANSIKIPHIAIAYNPGSTVGDYNVSFLTPVAAQTPAFVGMLQKKGYHNLAIFGVRNATWQPIVDELHKLSDAKKLNIVFEKIYAPGERDFRFGFQSMPKEGVDAVVFLSWSPEVNILMKQYVEQNIQKPVLSLGGAFLMSSERHLFEGCLDVFFGDCDESNRMNMKMTGRSLSSPGAPLIHDEILLLVDIYERLAPTDGGLPTSEAVMKEIKRTTNYQGTLGAATYHDDKYFYFPVYVYRILKDGFAKVPLDEL